jgi:hypothetical protein
VRAEDEEVHRLRIVRERLDRVAVCRCDRTGLDPAESRDALARLRDALVDLGLRVPGVAHVQRLADGLEGRSPAAVPGGQLACQCNGPLALGRAVVGRADPVERRRPAPVSERCDRHRTRRVLQHRAPVVVDERALGQVAAGRSDHEQVGVMPGGEFVEPGGHRDRFDDHDVRVEVRLVPQRPQGLHDGLSVRGEGHRGRVGVGRWGPDLHVGERDLSTRGGQLLRERQRVPAGFGVVGADDDVVEHGDAEDGPVVGEPASSTLCDLPGLSAAQASGSSKTSDDGSSVPPPRCHACH